MMQIDKNPFFRKAFLPWYSTDTACLIKSVVMVVVVLFAVEGIKVAGKVEAYGDYIWVPVLLLVMSLIVLMTNIIRLFQRYLGNRAM